VKSVSHISTYSSIIPGTAGSVISPATTQRRCKRGVKTSRNEIESGLAQGRLSTASFYLIPAMLYEMLVPRRKKRVELHHRQRKLMFGLRRIGAVVQADGVDARRLHQYRQVAGQHPELHR
jgi:hypothetical protein